MTAIYVRYITKGRPIVPNRDIPTAANYVRSCVAADNLDETRRSDCARTFNKYLKDPCQSFCYRYGGGLLELALFDAEMLSSSLEPFNLNDPELVPFFEALSIYRVCSYIHSSRYFINKAITYLEDLEIKAGNSILARIRESRPKAESSSAAAGPSS